MKYFINLLLFLIFTSIVFIACDDTLPTEIPIPEKDVSYAKHIQPIFNNHCNNSGCHNSEDNAGGVSLTSYGDLFATPFLIIKYSPNESHLYLAVSGQSISLMPPPYGNAFPLSDNQINGIKTWIEEGAEAN